MRNLFIISVLLISHSAFAAELFTLTRADHDFDSHIRVGIPAQIVEAPDASLIGQASPYIQSLRYTASKQVVLNLQFPSLIEITVFVQDQLCKEVHDVTLIPIRDLGTKGANSFNVKMKAKMITVSGMNVTAKNKPFTQTLVCK